MYMTSDDMAAHLFSPVRRIRIELGDPTIGRVSDDAWQAKEMRRSLVRMENHRKVRRARSR